MECGIKIERLMDLPDGTAKAAAMRGGIDAVFFETAARVFAVEPAKAAFRDLWLGQYLRLDPERVWVALDGGDSVVGYLVGCFDDPARSPRFQALSYLQSFAATTARYPAHLHVNLTARVRGRGIGEALVEAFCGQARGAGISGVHVVTGAEARNVSFYTRLGFLERGATRWNDKSVLLLGRDL